MAVMRVGLVPDMETSEMGALHRAALVISRKATEHDHYGHAAAGHLQQDAGLHRMPEVGACVVWGRSEEAMARVMLRHPCAVMMVVTPRKPKKAGALQPVMERLARSGIDLHVVVQSAKMQTAWDLGPNRSVEEVSDLTRPPQQQHAPAIPRKPVEPVDAVHAPAVPRDARDQDPVVQAPAVPRSSVE